MPLTKSNRAAPLFFSERALEKLQRRKTPPATYNLDLNL
ncbi:aminotran_5 domain-containing protein, partial [Haematococcus lacustris]